MGKCFSCSVFGICLSVWAIIQLTIMGYFYHKEAVTLIHDVEPEEYADFDEFIKICEENYQSVAHNCFVAAYVYVGILIVSILGMLWGRRIDAKALLKKDDDELFCVPPEAVDKKKVLIK